MSKGCMNNRWVFERNKRMTRQPRSSETGVCDRVCCHWVTDAERPVSEHLCLGTQFKIIALKWLFCCWTTFLIYDWHVKSCLFLMCTAQWAWGYIYTQETITTIKTRNLSITSQCLLLPFIIILFLVIRTFNVRSALLPYTVVSYEHWAV